MAMRISQPGEVGEELHAAVELSSLSERQSWISSMMVWWRLSERGLRAELAEGQRLLAGVGELLFDHEGEADVVALVEAVALDEVVELGPQRDGAHQRGAQTACISVYLSAVRPWFFFARNALSAVRSTSSSTTASLSARLGYR